MDFTPEAEDEVIREAVSQKLDRPLVNPSKQFGETEFKVNLLQEREGRGMSG